MTEQIYNTKHSQNSDTFEKSKISVCLHRYRLEEI